MSSLVELKTSCEDFDVEFDIAPVIALDEIADDRKKRVIEGIASVDEQLAVVQDKIAVLNKDIENLTNHADGIDYAIAVTSGIVTGILDATIVGEWNFAEAKKESYNEINNKVVSFAKKQPDYFPYCNIALEGKGNPRLKPKDPNRLETAISYLEWKFHLPGDGAYREGQFGIDGSTHRIDDLCHHPTLVGLVCCIFIQFSNDPKTKYVNKFGENINIPITINEYGNFVGNTVVTKLFSGVINWFITCAKTIANRQGHLMSDIATSACLPGSFLSTITELASIPCFRNEDFLVKLRNAYKKGIGTEKGQVDLGVFNSLFSGAQSKFDAAAESSVSRELKRQALPVVINEILVRASFFIRRFISELKTKQNVSEVEWKNIIPVNNRTIVRMMTIATGTFTSVDMADAAIHAAAKSVDASTFLSNMVLRVNFVGVGRLAIAVSVDTGMGINRVFKTNSRIRLQNEEIQLLNAKVFYKQAGMWIAAENAGKSIEEAYDMVEETTIAFVDSALQIKNSLSQITELVPQIEKKNPGLISELSDILEWG